MEVISSLVSFESTLEALFSTRALIWILKQRTLISVFEMRIVAVESRNEELNGPFEAERIESELDQESFL